jgi:hypothetical protein
MLRPLLLAFAAFALAPNASAQNATPFVGTWKLNIEKSKFTPENLAPTNATWKIEGVEGGIKMISDSQMQGQAVHVEYTAKFDGKDYPVTTTIDGKTDTFLSTATISWRNTGERTYETNAKINGQELGLTHMTISADGKTITASVDTSIQGQTLSSNAVWEKQ